MAEHETKRLQSRIMAFAMLGILLTGVIVGLATGIPLYRDARSSAEQAAAFNVEVRALAVGQLIGKWRDVAQQVTSRRAIRDMLDQYLAGEVGLKRLQAFTAPKLADALSENRDAVALTRLGPKGQVLVHLGRPLPPALRRQLGTEVTDDAAVHMAGPIRLDDGRDYLVVAAPILSHDHRRLGTDLVTFGIAPLAEVLSPGDAFDPDARTLLVHRGAAQLLTAGATGWHVAPVPQHGALARAIAEVAAGHSDVIPGGLPQHDDQVLFYTPLAHSGWGLILQTEARALYAPALRELSVPLASILVMLLVGMVGTHRLIRPLASDVITQTERLAALADDQQALLEYARGYVYRHDAEGRYSYLSEGVGAVTGYDAAQFRRRHPQMLTDNPINAEVAAYTRRSLSGEETPPYLVEIRHRDGHPLTLEVNERPQREQGRVVGVVGVARDVTDRVRAQQALRESEERLRTLINATPDIICFKDGEGRWLEANEADIELFRLRGVEYRGKRDSELAAFTHPIYRDAFLSCEVSDERAWRAGAPNRAEEVIPTADGARRVFDILKVPVFGESGERRGLVVVGRDISERKWAEEELALAASVFQGSEEGILILDPMQRFMRVNAAFTRITGYEVEELKARAFCELLDKQWSPPNACNDIDRALAERGSWRGELWYRRRDGEPFPVWQNFSAIHDERGELLCFTGIFTDISDKKDFEARIQYLAHYDLLTSLPNRALLTDRLGHALERASRAGRHLALLFVDLDRFKNVNDSLGHPIGDRLLRVTAERLQQAVNEQDTVARLGGDEFIVLVEEWEDTRDAGNIARRVLDRLAEPVRLEGYEIFIGASIGISVYPDDGGDADTLIKNADAAMYRAKDRGRNTYEYYTPELTRLSFERLDLEVGLRRALERDELVLHFQPQALAADGRIVGVEALVRWQHPEKGMIPPDVFIPVAEETGLIDPLGAWVLRKACEQAQRWDTAGMPPLRMAVNLSMHQLAGDGIVPLVRQVLEESRMEPQRLELEITEGVMVRHADRTVAMLGELKALGVTLAVDDFGTGYSSLSYLKRLPIDRLKIDRSFVRDIPGDRDDVAIATTIIAMARHLNLKVIAEGVEEQVQLALLAENGCDEYQGYFLSRPVPAAEIEGLLRRSG